MSDAGDAIYDHLRFVVERDDAASVAYAQKAKHAIALHVVLFGGLSFAFGRLDWATNVWLWLVSLLLTAISASALMRAFVAGLGCIRINDTSVVGVSKLLDNLRTNPELANSPDLRLQLAQNLATAIRENRKRGHHGRRYARALNRWTRCGAILTAILIGYSLVGESVARTITKDTSMTQDERPRPDDSDQSQPFVEPSDSIQAGDDATPDTFIEPSDTVQRGDQAMEESR